MPTADELIGPRTVESLLSAVRTAVPGADLASLRAAGSRIAPLTLRERADLLRDALLTDLPGTTRPWTGRCAGPATSRPSSPDG
ncbi:hypothetical protein [Actinoplanes sp. CA-252034]|uniref:hypothetical protein n=1 Tax=Actinoplanes sp. CA-252034 TaxID=3239906 RepID=UPI003D95F31C